MEYLYKYFNPIAERKKKQLLTEEKIDRKLRECDCHEKVTEYLLNLRELNRKQTIKACDSSLYTVHTVYKKKLDVVDSVHEKVSDYSKKVIYKTLLLKLNKERKDK
uniref:Uncharacterized protein n=1 Tax=Iridovirus LCIVAC01 TaxID=2506607 RepID=A0A481YR75_9VIRU|nr:MAG: hypothetical protein LCIVAC01_02160 [Iridovirus LCIVAC01]